MGPIISNARWRQGKRLSLVIKTLDSYENVSMVGPHIYIAFFLRLAASTEVICTGSSLDLISAHVTPRLVFVPRMARPGLASQG